MILTKNLMNNAFLKTPSVYCPMMVLSRYSGAARRFIDGILASRNWGLCSKRKLFGINGNVHLLAWRFRGYMKPYHSIQKRREKSISQKYPIQSRSNMMLKV
jgi:hypothetical protein